MDELVKQFLLTKNYISLGNLGTLSIKKTKAENETAALLFNYDIQYDAVGAQPQQAQLNWFQNTATAGNETFDSYCNKLSYTLQTKNKVEIEGVGVFEKNSGTISFTPVLKIENPFTPVAIQKIRKPQPSSVIQNQELPLLSEKRLKSKTGLYYWLILVLLLAAFVLYLFMNYSLSL